MKKRDFFSKISIKDYNNTLEEILEKKNFSSNAKNLLLSMLYKIELAYQDYQTIKRTSISQKQFIEELIEIIEYDCEKIELVEPNSKKGRVLSKYGMSSITDETYKTIISYPIEKELLYALYELAPNKFDIKDEYYILKYAIPRTLKIGNCINNKEIIRDFSGWSWEIETKDIENFELNLIYQNVRILLDAAFLYEWYHNKDSEKDYLLKMKESLIENFGQENAEKFYNNFLLFSVILNMNVNQEVKQYIFKEQQRVDQEKNLMLDKTKFLDKMTEEKKKTNVEIKKIDKILNNKELLEKELERRNQEKQEKIANIDSLEFVLRNRRRDLIKQMEKYTNLMDPKKYAKNMESLEKKEEMLQKIDRNMLSEEWMEYKMLELQKNFIACLRQRVEHTLIKAEIIEYLYHLRYYKKIPFDKEKRIEQVDELKAGISHLEDILIVKGINLKILNIVTKNGNYNVEIIKQAINSKIANLEKIELEIKPKYSKLQIAIYDGDILERQFEIETNGSASKVELKTNKKFKLFI